ncbi:organic solvent tolerance protein [Candidatus Pelagibacter sp.]|nr:organic solvent tolerance protein [Candidatus Pelagibacter sp.]
MINNLKNTFFLIFCSFFIFEIINANEPFVFDVTEIEVLKNGNQINGYKGGTATSKDGSKIIGETFLYNKLTNILEVIGDVKYIDNSKNIIITSDKAIYLKNNEKIFTIGNSKAVNENNTITASNLEYDKIQNIFKAEKNAEINDIEKNVTIYADKFTYLKNKEKVFTIGKTKALIEKKYIFNSENVSYLRNIEELSSQKKSSVLDADGNVYELSNFLYDIAKEILKGDKVNVLAKINDEKVDKYFFSEGFFDFKNKKHIAKETKVKIHKDVFGDMEHDPRVYGSSSFSNANETIINNGIFTSCKINDNCPPWSIKAEKIIHDKIKRDMIYKNAILKIYDVPVLYFPKFYHPDPSVKRRDGFLQPQFNNSDTLGSSLYIPYFKTLGHDKDLTFKPTLFEKLKKNFKNPKKLVKEGFFEKEKYLLQTEFRKKNKNSSLIADFGFLRNYKSSIDNKTRNANHIFLDYKSDLEIPNYSNSTFEAQIERVNNDTYLKVFDSVLLKTPVMPGSQSTMNSNLKFNLDQEYQNFSTGFEIHESLGAKSSDRYQFTLPYYYLSKNLINVIDDYSIGGSLDFYSSGNNSLTNTNNLKTTIVNDINYLSSDYISNLGFKNNFNLFFKNLNSVGKNDAIYTSNAQIDGMSILKFDTIFPLSKTKELSKEILTPKISFRINPANNMNDYSKNSSNINANNVFDINRLGITDDFEAGKSLTFGLDYKFDQLEKDISENEKQKDKYLELKLATVIRDQKETDVPISSTINRKNSDIFASINNRLFDNVNLLYNVSIDNDMKTINSNTIETEISINNFITTFNFIEQRNELGSTHILSNVTEYKIDNNNSLKFKTRRNKEINLTEYYDLSYEYKNDCLTAALRFNKTFYQDNDLVPTEDLFFSITLVPLTTYEREIYKKKPGTMGLRAWFR